MSQYIEMCKAATEIQKAWEPKVGDKAHPARAGDVPLIGLVDYSDIPKDIKATHTYLPRIEDLMKMLSYISKPDGSGSGRGDGSILRDCLAYANENHKIMAGHGIVDAPGLFLCFAMYEIYDKSWNGTTWETA